MAAAGDPAAGAPAFPAGEPADGADAVAGRNGPAGDEPAGDSVAALLQDWARERPDLDFSPVGIATRLARVRAHLDTGLQQVFDRYDLTAADFAVIVTLRRAGAPCCLPQARLIAQLGLTSGTVSVRVDRLVSRGVVTREAAPGDRRAQLVRLTAEGLRLFDEIAPVHLANEDRLLSALSPAERAGLAALLQRLLASFEDTRPQIVPGLGAALFPAHVARTRRAAVGLSDPPGLLVAAPPLPGTPAAAAGLRQGDLITAVSEQPVHSVIALAEVLAGAAAGTALRLSVLRAEQRRELQIRLGARGAVAGAPAG
ncbi:MAG: MarR family transcriptional regulator [Streptosporangiaceae bacterium]